MKIIKPNGVIEKEPLDTDNVLAHLQRVVDGYIEVIKLRDGRYMIINEEGYIRDLEVNTYAKDLVKSLASRYNWPNGNVHGTVIILSDVEGEYL